jgi:hypothetical protein
MGPKWAQIGILVGRHPEACKDKWRILKVTNKKSGQCAFPVLPSSFGSSVVNAVEDR